MFLTVSTKDKSFTRQIQIDDADVDTIANYNWFLLIYAGQTSVVTTDYLPSKGEPVIMARLLLGTYGKKGCVTRHANGDRLDNRRSNLSTHKHIKKNEPKTRVDKKSKITGRVNLDDYGKGEHKALIDREMERFLARGGQIEYLAPRYTIPEPVIGPRGYNPTDDALDDPDEQE